MTSFINIVGVPIPGVISPVLYNMVHSFSFIVLLTCMGCVTIVSGTTLQAKEALYDDLLSGYHQYLRPGTNQSHPTDLKTLFSIIALKEFDEKTAKFSITGYFTFQWTDERMSWDPNSYNGTTKIGIPQSLVWVPLILMANPFEEMPELGVSNQMVSYSYNGEAIWSPGNIYDTFCTAKIEYFPFDVQECSFFFSPWGNTKEEIFMTPISESIDYSQFNPNGKWNITKSSLYIQNMDSIQILTLNFSFVRRSHFDVVNTIVPIVLFEVMLILVFLIPVESGERIGYATTMLLAVTVYMTIISDRLPDVSHPDISYFTYFLASDIILGFLLMLCLIWSLNIYYMPEVKDIPRCFKCCLTSAKMEKKTEEPNPEKGVTWQDIAVIFDRICVAMFVFLHAVKATIAFTILTANSVAS